ncbi:putative Werner syndrome helicase [Podospora australis]|uniref:Werner syndrome helicase n=1 Tax=Podospora australis TaxID=1536484 RepID=A0AAN6X349_9PEZI|nr:putative Werner syndrome helicase [Podospora australis]
MGTDKPAREVWHVSHGIVFGRQRLAKVAYPTRSTTARYHRSAQLEFLKPSRIARALDEESSSAGLSAENAQESADGVAKPADAEEAMAQKAKEAEEGKETEQKNAEEEDDSTVPEPPFTPLEFKIPVEAFQSARKAAEGTPESFWTYSLYRGPGGTEGVSDAKVKVHYCTSLTTTERVLQQYFMHEKVIGLDLEWAPDALKHQGARRNVSVIQLASPSRIAIFHIALYPKGSKGSDLVSPTLKKLIEDPEITKCGVWIKGDCSRLRSFMGIDARSIFELSHLYKLVTYSTSGETDLINKRLVSLAQQTKDVLGLPLFKGQDVRSSDWSKPLDMSQIIYSASDAYAAVQLYAVLNHQREQLNPCPPLPAHAELNKPIELADHKLLQTAGEEEAETEAAAAAAAAADQGPVLSANYLKSLAETVTCEFEPDAETEPNTSTTTTTTTPKKRSATKEPKDPRITEGDLWAAQYRVAHPKTRATNPSLRAYYIWHKNEDLGPSKIAGLLRDPPLQLTTVINYILEAIRIAKLPFNKQRLRAELLDQLPAEMVQNRYKSVVKLCNEGDGWEVVTKEEL